MHVSLLLPSLPHRLMSPPYQPYPTSPACTARTACIHACTHARARKHTHKHTRLHARTHSHTLAHAWVEHMKHTHARTHTRARTHAHTHTHTHTHNMYVCIYIYLCVCVCVYCVHIYAYVYVYVMYMYIAKGACDQPQMRMLTGLALNYTHKSHAVLFWKHKNTRPRKMHECGQRPK